MQVNQRPRQCLPCSTRARESPNGESANAIQLVAGYTSIAIVMTSRSITEQLPKLVEYLSGIGIDDGPDPLRTRAEK